MGVRIGRLAGLGLLVVGTLCLGFVACSSNRTAETAAKSPAQKRALRDGFYAVLGTASTQDSARAVDPRAAIVVYDRVYTDVVETVPPEYVAIDTTSFIPLALSAPPEAKKDDRGWTLLSVSLSKEQVKPLEEFTRARLGGRVAILLDGEVISMHKIRSVITEGKVQITRCGDNACDVLLSKLTD